MQVVQKNTKQEGEKYNLFTPPNIQNGTKYELNNIINYIKTIYHIILNYEC